MAGNRDNRGNSTPRPEDIRRDNSDFLRKLLSSLNAAVETREKAGTYGEITVKIAQQDGRITGAKVLEETILKPTDT